MFRNAIKNLINAILKTVTFYANCKVRRKANTLDLLFKLFYPSFIGFYKEKNQFFAI